MSQRTEFWQIILWAWILSHLKGPNYLTHFNDADLYTKNGIFWLLFYSVCLSVLVPFNVSSQTNNLIESKNVSKKLSCLLQWWKKFIRGFSVIWKIEIAKFFTFRKYNFFSISNSKIFFHYKCKNYIFHCNVSNLTQVWKKYC